MRLVFKASEQQSPTVVSLDQFITLARGRSIVDIESWGDQRMDLVLSGDLRLSIIFTGINPMSEASLTQLGRSDELPSFTLSLGDMPKRIPTATLERKLRGLRTLYAITYLTETHRTTELLSFLRAVPAGDVEANLLSPDEMLYIESVSHGSWVVVAWAKSREAFKALSQVVGIAYQRGRDAYLTKVEAQARLEVAKARQQEVAAAKAEFELHKTQMDYLMRIAGKAATPEHQKLLKEAAIAAVRDLTLGDKRESATNALLLAAPKPTDSDA